MRTFSEACERVFCKRITKEMDDATITAALHDAQQKFASIAREVVDSPEVDGLVEMLYQLYQRESDFSVDAIIKNAFAQGVAVGIEMERTETASTDNDHRA